MTRRQTEGKETWSRLLDWDRGQAPSERLAAQILRIEGYESIDPSHPLGGPDGLKDIICIKDKARFVGASFFPRGKQRFSRIKKKYTDDLEGIAKNNANGIAFVTNQELTLSEREELKEEAGTGGIEVDLFHLERIASILNSPTCYGIRLEYLDIEMTKEEHLAYMANITNRLDELLTAIKHFDTVRKDDVVRKKIERLFNLTTPDYVPAISVDEHFPWNGNQLRLKSCSECGRGYLVTGVSSIMAMAGGGRNAAICPKCGNAEYV